MSEKLIKKRYLLKDLISEDILYFLYEAEDVYTREPVTVWQYKNEFLTRDVVLMLHQKAQDIMKLSGQNILKMRHCFYEEGFIYTVNDTLVDYICLEEFLKNGRYSIKQLWEIVAQILTALLAIEDQGLVCGSVDFLHIFINQEGSVKIANVFFNAEILRHNLAQFPVLDNALFLSPEYLQKQNLTIAGDIYALGVLMYVFFSRRWPYPYTTNVAQLKESFLGRQTPFRKALPALPDKISQLIQICLRFNPKLRFASFAELVRDYKNEALEQSFNVANLAVQADFGREMRRDLRLDKFKMIVAGIKIYLVSFFLLAIAYFSYNLYVEYATSIPEKRIPNLINLTPEAAKAMLSKQNLKSQVSGSRVHNSVPVGLIIESKPPAGRLVKEGRLIKLFISEGAGRFTLPDLLGRTLEQARSVLKNRAGHVLVSGEVYFLHKPQGLIIGQVPSPNDSVAVSSNVSVRISAGLPVTIEIENSPRPLDLKKPVQIRLLFHTAADGQPLPVTVYYIGDTGKSKLLDQVVDFTVTQNFSFSLRPVGIISVYFDGELGLTQDLQALALTIPVSPTANNEQ